LKLLSILLAAVLVICLCSCANNIPETEPSPEFIPSHITETTSLPETTPATDPPITELPTTEVTQPEIPQPEPKDEDFVRVLDYIPNLVVELRYATENNFTGQKIYEFQELWLRYGTVKKLMVVQEALEEQQMSLKVWDGFRPPAAQFKLWEVYPDSTYVSNPNKGFSSHSRGNTVDLTMIYADGTDVPMPTGFDDFSILADRDYSDCPKDVAANALLLEETMSQAGFKPYRGEWWHFTDRQSYPVEQDFEPISPIWYYAHCNEYINLRTQPSTGAPSITTIAANEPFQIFARCGSFFLAEYQGVLGYVLSGYTLPMEQQKGADI
jgi:D-alanyl-D-alanine dipeptidase